MRSPLLIAQVVLSLTLLIHSAQGQQAPELGYMHPPVVTAGTTTSVQLGGFDFTPDMQWFVHDERIELEILGDAGEYSLPPPPYWFGPRASTPALPIPREVPARITVPADYPSGWVQWQVANANGASGTARFYVSRGIELTESRWRDDAQPLPSLPVGVSGRLSRLAEVDRYQWTAHEDGLISVDLMARRLGADFLGVLQVHDAAGRMVADHADTTGQDGGVTFAAQAGESYAISLHDIDFRGDPSYVYRLEFTAGPRVLCMLPAAGELGTEQEVEFVGIGIETGACRLESIRRVVTFPKGDADSLNQFSSTDPAQPVRKSDMTFRYSLDTPLGTVEVPVPLSDFPEVQPNEGQWRGEERVDAPLAISGRLPPDVSEHRYRWGVKEDELWELSLQSQGVGGVLDVHLTLLDPEGNLVAESDDLPGTTDAGLTFRATTTGDYMCVIRDLTSRKGELTEIYRLAIERLKPDFSLELPQQIVIPSGGQVEFVVRAQRSGGFAEEIRISVDGLPSGVHTEGDWLIPAGQAEAKLVLRADADAAVVAAAIWITGSAVLQGKKIWRRATTSPTGLLPAHQREAARTAPILLAMTMAPPFELLLVDRERQREVHRGTTYRAEFEIVRHDGFEGGLQLRMAARQARYRQGIRGGTVTVPSDADRALYPCFMPEWLSTDLTRRMVVQGVAQLPDPQGNPRYLVKNADSRITMIMEGALLKVSSSPGTHVFQPGECYALPVQVTRSPKLPVSVTVDLEVPVELEGLWKAEPLTLDPDQDSGIIRLQAPQEESMAGNWTLKLVARALEDGRWPVISEVDIPVIFGERRPSIQIE